MVPEYQAAPWRALRIYAAALALSPICWIESLIRVRKEPLAETSSWLCAVPFQPESGLCVNLYAAVWLAAHIYAQCLLWPQRWIHEDISGKARINMVWVCITSWGLAGIFEIFIAAMGYAGVDPSTAVVAAAMIGLAVGLAKDADRVEDAR